LANNRGYTSSYWFGNFLLENKGSSFFYKYIGDLSPNNDGKIWFAKLIKGTFIKKMKITKLPKA